MKETSPIVYNELAKTHSPANSDVVISPKHIKVAEDSKNLLKNSAAGLSVTVADIVSEDAGNKLREGADGRLYGAATEASELISARDDNQITLGADDKLYVASPTGQDVLSKEEDNLLRHGNDKGVYLNGRDVLSNDGQNHLTVSDVDKRVTFIPDYKEWVSGDRNNALSTADDGKIFLDKKDLCHCEMTIPEGVTVVSQDPDNVLSTGSEGGAYLGSDDVCKVVNQQIEGGCIEVVSNTGGNLLTEGLDHRSYLGCNTIEDAIQSKCIRVVSPNRDNVLSTDSAGRAFLGCEAADRLITQGCMGLKSGQEGNLLTEDDEHRLVLDKLAVNSTAEQGITDGDITVVSKDEGNVLTEGTDKRAFLDCSAVDGKITDGCINVTSTDDANILTKGNDNRSYLGKAAVNSTVEQGITSGDVTVVSTDEENLLTKGSSDKRAYLGKDAVNTTVEAGITAGDVTVVSTDENNIISAGTDGRAYLKCETVNEKVTEGCIDVVSTDDKNLITAGSDNRAMLSESAVNAAVEQGITDGAVTVVSKDADNLLTEGTEDKRAYLSKDAICTAINDNIASGCVDLVSPNEGNLITKDASGKVFLNCEAIKDCTVASEPECRVNTGVDQLSLYTATYYPTRPGKYRFYLKNSGGGGSAGGMLTIYASIGGGVPVDPVAIAATTKKMAFVHVHAFSGCAGEPAQTRTKVCEVDVTQDMIDAGISFKSTVGSGGKGGTAVSSLPVVDVSSTIQAVDLDAGTYKRTDSYTPYTTENASLREMLTSGKGLDGGDTTLAVMSGDGRTSQVTTVTGGFGGMSMMAWYEEYSIIPDTYKNLSRSVHGRLYDGDYQFCPIDVNCVFTSGAAGTISSIDVLNSMTSMVNSLFGGSSLSGVIASTATPVLGNFTKATNIPSSGGNFYAPLGLGPLALDGGSGERGVIIAELDKDLYDHYENSWLVSGEHKTMLSSIIFIEELGIAINYLGGHNNFLVVNRNQGASNKFAYCCNSGVDGAVAVPYDEQAGKGGFSYKVVEPTETLNNAFIYNLRTEAGNFAGTTDYYFDFNNDLSYAFYRYGHNCVSNAEYGSKCATYLSTSNREGFATEDISEYFSTDGQPKFLSAYGVYEGSSCCEGRYSVAVGLFIEVAKKLSAGDALKFVDEYKSDDLSCCDGPGVVYKSGPAKIVAFFSGIDDAATPVYADTVVTKVDGQEHSGSFTCDFLKTFGIQYLGSGVVLMELECNTKETSCFKGSEPFATVTIPSTDVEFVVQLKDACGNVVVESDPLLVKLEDLGNASSAD